MPDRVSLKGFCHKESDMAEEERKEAGKPEVTTGLDNQIRFVEFMLEGYREPTGQMMLTAIRESLEKLKEISGRDAT